ncbi:MAG: methyl-accepting chemotaxis protein [Myxococcales bacterium]|nr:methyl-accepting chemotaxis protein [Myxococcales bacterium]
MSGEQRAWWMGVTPKFAAFIVVVIAALCLANVWTATRALMGERTSAFEQKASVIALDVLGTLDGDADASMARSVRVNRTHRGVRYIAVVEKDGHPLVHTFTNGVPEEFRGAVANASRISGDQGLRVARDLSFRASDGVIHVLDVLGTSPRGVAVHVGMDLDLIEDEASRIQKYMLSAGSGVGLVGILVLVWIARTVVVRPIQELTRVTSEIVRKGDLTQEIGIKSEDEIGELARSFNGLMKRLREIPTALRDSTELLAASVADLSAFMTGQSQMLTKQAAALQETQVTAQEIKQTSLVAAQKAEAVIQVTERAESVSRGGEAAVEQSLKALFDMRAQVEEMATRIAGLGDKTVLIGDITQTVKDLADQSNMLALNAAIEAVRSGEHGRGFSVVAREIRSLADQSIQATNRVREILEDVRGAVAGTVTISERGSSRIDAGLKDVRTTGEKLTELSGIVKENSAVVRQINAAVGQQNAGVAQIFSAITDQNRMMEDTMKRLSQTESAVKTIEDVAIRLVKLVDEYKF